MRRILAVILALGVMTAMTACAKKNAAADANIADKTYVWEKEGAGGDFTITLNRDGTYLYYAGYLSSYIGQGNWTLEDGVLTMTESSGYDFVFRFSVENGELCYIAEGSDKFMYVTVEDGDRFLPGEAATPVTAENAGTDSPGSYLDRLFASGDITLTLHLASGGAYPSYPADAWYSDRFRVLLDGYDWTRLEMPSTEPSEFWLTAASADGTADMKFWSDRGAGTVQFSDGSTSSFWKASPKSGGSESIARDIRMEYDNLDVDCTRISFPADGGAEEAADTFVHSAFGGHMAGLAPGSIYGISDYEVVDWTVREVSEKGDAVVGSFEYAFVPWDFNSPGVWAGNTAEGAGDYEGKLTCYREFVLQRQEDGLWHCTGLGTGGYTLPE